jgi:hypothetical protein
MRFTSLLPFLLATGAYAGRIERRQTTPSSSSSIAPTPSQSACAVFGSTVLCRVDGDCTTGNRCQFVTRNADNSGCDGQCVSTSSSSSSATPVPSASGLICPSGPYAQACSSDAQCASSNLVCVIRSDNPTPGCGYCSTQEEKSSVAFYGSRTSTSSNSASSTSSANPSTSTCGMVNGLTICRSEVDCASGQRCQFATRNPNMSGCDGYCVDLASSSSSAAASATSSSSASSLSSAAAPSGSTLPKQCTYNLDCPLVTTYCNQQSQCVTYDDCRAVNGSCPGGM